MPRSYRLPLSRGWRCYCCYRARCVCSIIFATHTPSNIRPIRTIRTQMRVRSMGPKALMHTHTQLLMHYSQCTMLTMATAGTSETGASSSLPLPQNQQTARCCFVWRLSCQRVSSFLRCHCLPQCVCVFALPAATNNTQIVFSSMAC